MLKPIFQATPKQTATLVSKLRVIGSIGIITAALISIASSSQGKSTSQPNSKLDIHPITQSENTNIEEHRMCVGKPGAQVSLSNTLKQNLTLLEEEQITLKLTSKMTTGYLSVTIKTDEGLELTSEQSAWEFELTPKTELTLPISIYANQYGNHYLNIFTQHISEDGRKSSRALAMEFAVAEEHANMFKTFTKSTALTNSTIISLPSKETIF